MPRLTDAELHEIRERCEKATPGPWYTGHTEESFDYAEIDSAEKHVCEVWNRYNKVFICAARTDIPRLLDEIDSLREELASRRSWKDMSEKERLTAVAKSDREEVEYWQAEAGKARAEAAVLREAVEFVLSHQTDPDTAYSRVCRKALAQPRP